MLNNYTNIKLIAEIGINHDGKIEKAQKLIQASAESGAHGIKFQYRNLKNSYASNKGEEIGDEIIKSEITRNYLAPSTISSLVKEAKNLGLKVGISFFSVKDIDDFTSLDSFDFFKIPSVEFQNKALRNTLLNTGKDVLLSTGCQNENEIREVINDLLSKKNWTLLHCISNYPLAIRNSKLGYLNHLSKICGRRVGYSSHDEYWENCLIAATLGASIIERHITLSKDSIGLDHSSSSDINEFKRLNYFLKSIPLILSGDFDRSLNQGELLNKQNLGRSLYAKENCTKDDLLILENFVELSPQIGLTRNQFSDLSNKQLKRNISKGEVVQPSHFQNPIIFKSENKVKANKLLLSLPIRAHDFVEVEKIFNLKNYEFHLSFKEVLSGELESSKYPDDKFFSIHLPDYISPEYLIDPFSNNDEILSLSQRVIENIKRFSLDLQERTGNKVPIVGSFSLIKENKKDFYLRIADLIANLMNDEILLLPQWLPPVAWYFGGSVDIKAFNSSEDVEYIKNYDIPICLDICHFLMGLSAKTVSHNDFDILKNLSCHLHLADSIGVDGEGVKIGEGDESNRPYLIESINSDKVKVLEVWQGHLNNFEGFHKAIDSTILLTEHA